MPKHKEDREEFTRREFIELLLHTIKDEVWGMADGDLEELADQFGIWAESGKHGTFSVRSIDK